jgi:probable rRNA maturation factor
MSLPTLDLSLQFALPAALTPHKKVLTRAKVSKWLRHSLDLPGAFTVRIVDEVEGLQLNESYRQKAYATNVLTFDYSQEPVVCADLVLCAPVVEREALEQGKSLEAHYAHLLVHGALHAQGYDHELGDEEAEAMEAQEVAILARLGFANPYEGV